MTSGLQDYLKHIVHGSVEEKLNASLYAEADRWCDAGRNQRMQGRQGKIETRQPWISPYLLAPNLANEGPILTHRSNQIWVEVESVGFSRLG